MRWKILEILENFKILPVVVFMLKGLAFNWKQPVGSYVTSSQSIVTKLGASVSKPYFMQNNNRVIVFCDSPHLLKNIHHNLEKLGFKVGEQCCFILL